jgi:hypothetical protein
MRWGVGAAPDAGAFAPGGAGASGVEGRGAGTLRMTSAALAAAPMMSASVTGLGAGAGAVGLDAMGLDAMGLEAAGLEAAGLAPGVMGWTGMLWLLRVVGTVTRADLLLPLLVRGRVGVLN